MDYGFYNPYLLNKLDTIDAEDDAPPEHHLFVSVGDKFLRDMMARG